MISLRYPLGLTLLLSLGACQSTVPIVIREAPAGSPPLSEAREKVRALEGVPVRWGGTIVSIKNRENDTLIEILGKALGSDGEPVAADDSLGRFMVRV
jgi:outer membrane lipoprotein